MRGKVVHCLFAAACIALLCGAGSPDDNRTYDLGIAGQDVRAALTELARQTGTQLLFSYDLVRPQHSNPLMGRYTVQQALQLLLRGTGLSGQITGSGVITISPAAEPPKSGAPPGDSSKRGLVSRMLASISALVGGRKAPTDSPETVRGRSLEEVVVTAEKRAESIQKVPIAISAFSAQTLSRRGIEGLEDLPQVVPSLQFTGQEASFANISIRGVGNALQGLDVEPAVAVIQDGVPFASQWVNLLDFFDVRSVDVLRGPQGTISGRSATAGAVLIESNPPTNDVEGELKAIFGNLERIGTEGFLSGPLIDDRLLGRVAIRTDHTSGWVRNTLLGRDLGGTDEIQARVSLLAHLSDSLDARLILEGTHDRPTPFLVDPGRARPDLPTLSDYYGVASFDPRMDTLLQNQSTTSDIQKYDASLRLDWLLGKSTRLTAISGFLNSHLRLGLDLDASALPGLLTAPGTPDTDIAQLSQELTLTTDLTDRSDLIVGVLYLRQVADNLTTFGAPLIGVPAEALSYQQRISLNSWGGYAQWRYRITPRLRLSAGVRKIYDSKSLHERERLFGTPIEQLAEASWGAWTPRIAFDFVPSQNLTLYSSASRGFKSGGFNSLSNPIAPFKQEDVWSYEAGMKATWLSGQLETGLSGFYMNYRDLQETLLGVGESSTFSARIVNAPSASVTGVELDLTALVTDRLRISFAAAWLDATYGKLLGHDTIYPELGVPGPDGLTLRDATGNQLVDAPKFQFNVSADYTHPLWPGAYGMFSASYAWQDRIYFDLFNNRGLSQGRYALINLSYGIETGGGRWRVTAFIRNLTDKFYLNGTQVQPTGPVPILVAEHGLPRTFGASLAYRF